MHIIRLLTGATCIPIAMVLMWFNLAGRADMGTTRKVIWLVVRIVWGLGPILYMVVAEGSLW